MKKNKLEVYELADVPVAFIEQVAQNVLELINTRMEADNADDYGVMPLGVPIELQATRLVLYSLASSAALMLEPHLRKRVISYSPP